MGKINAVICEDLMKVDDEPYTDIIISVLPSGKERVRHGIPEWIESLLDRSLLYQGDNKIVFSALPFDRSHLEDLRKLAGWNRVLNIYPTNPTSKYSICEDLLEDPELNCILKHVMINSPGVNLICRYETDGWYKLLDYLKNLGLRFKLPENRQPDKKFIPMYYDRKSGFRTAFATLLGKTTIKIPEGFIVVGKQEIADACFFFKQKSKSCVVKQDNGFSGEGIVFIDHLKFSSAREKFTQQVMESVNDEQCIKWGAWSSWEKQCCVVEEMVDIDKNNLKGVISVEYQLTEGKIEPLPPTSMLMARDGKTYQGIVMSPEVERNPLIIETLKAGRLFSEIVASQGYNGFLDMDCLISKDGDVYALESNVRRTGGTHVHQFLLCLLGHGYSNHYWCTNQAITYNETLDYESYRLMLEDIYMKREGKEQKCRGVLLLTSASLKKNAVDILIVSSSAEDFNFLRQEVQLRLDSVHSKIVVHA